MRIPLALAAIAALLPVRAGAQADTASTCLRFTFGAWTPALDWQGAGHGRSIDSTHVARDANGRPWAAPTGGSGAPGDTVLMLFPPWWPAGVSIEMRTADFARGDTVTGKATALVADARRVSPVAKARVWRVACAR
jgi:hypothetical protein